MSERERGPLESEIHELIRMKALSSPIMLKATTTGSPPAGDERLQQAELFGFVLMEALLRLAREIDDLRGRL